MEAKIPVLQIGDILLISIQSELHDQMAENMQNSILEKIHDTSASAVLIDITSIMVVDSFMGRILGETARMAHVLDSKMVIVGMQPEVSMTMLELGIELPHIESAADIESGLALLGYELKAIQGGNADMSQEGWEDIEDGKD